MTTDEWDDATETNAESPAVVVKQSKLGWIAFVIAFLGLGASVALLWVRADRESARAKSEADQRVAAEKRATAAESAVSAEKLRSVDLEDQVKKATAERDVALAEAKAAKDKLAAAEKTPAAVPKAKTKATPKKKKRK